MPRVPGARPHPLAALAVAASGLLLAGAFVATRALPAPPTVPREAAVAPTPAVVTPGPQTDPAAQSTGVPAPPSAFAGIGVLTAVPPSRSGMVRHTVAPGEVLWQIAERYGLRSETLLWTNDLADPDLILAGQTLLIPPVDGVLYTVRAGDRLADVALRYGIDAGEVARLNGLSNTDLLQARVDIFLPGARPLRPAGTPPADLVQAPPADEQSTAILAPPIPLPSNISQLLTTGWLRPERASALYRGPEASARPLHELPAGVPLERIEGFQGGRIQVRDPGDGRTRQAMTGWVDAVDLGMGRAPAPRDLPLSYPAATAMDIAQVFAPYRSQLDGSAYAAANCGPTTIGMALEAFGVNVSSRQLRQDALNAQRMWGNDIGTLITALATVVRQRGLSALDLTAPDGALRRWSLDDIRGHVAAGRPVVVQVRYRALPGRSASPYLGDHYLLVTGVVGDRFLYNDSINADGIGWDRALPADQLLRAMDASDRRYAYTAFAVSP